MKTQFAKPTTALCLALSSFNLFVSGPAGHAAEPPLNPWLWVLHDENPDWTNPPFEDSLTVLDTGGTVVFSVADRYRIYRPHPGTERQWPSAEMK